jgi:hypothetical protein
MTLAWFVGSAILRAQSSTVLYSSGFQDGDLSFWTLDGPVGATMVIDDAVGQPPGSMRIDAPSVSQNANARTPCFPFADSTAEFWQLSADVFRPTDPETGWECSLIFRLYSGEECDGNLLFEWSTTGGNSGQWNSRTVELFMLGLDPSPRSLLADLSVGPPEFGGGTCFFDNVELRGPGEHIPALGPGSFAGLVLLLAVTGMWILYRQR